MAIKIFIDQGHNPQNPNAGAEGNGLREQDLVYEIGVRLASLLETNESYSVRLSRNRPDEILGTSVASSLASRVNAANDWGADYFISLHANASSITSASGNEGYVFALGTVAASFSQSLIRGLTDTTGLPTRGVFARPTLYVLRKTRMPATLIELGFITNPGDAALMRDDPTLFARGLYNGINAYFAH